MSGMGKEKKGTGDLSNRVERFERGAFSGVFPIPGAFLGRLD